MKARQPEMLSSENDIQVSLRNLNRFGGAVARHAAYDKQASQQATVTQALCEKVKQHLHELTRLRVELAASRAGFLTSNIGDDRSRCQAARSILDEFAADYESLSQAAAQMAELIAIRAETGVENVDKEKLAQGIEDTERRLEELSRGLEANRRDIVELCKDCM